MKNSLESASYKAMRETTLSLIRWLDAFLGGKKFRSNEEVMETLREWIGPQPQDFLVWQR